jgi:hypothetical protein
MESFSQIGGDWQVHYSNVHRRFVSTLSPGTSAVVVGAKHRMWELGMQTALALLSPDINKFDLRSKL